MRDRVGVDLGSAEGSSAEVLWVAFPVLYYKPTDEEKAAGVRSPSDNDAIRALPTDYCGVHFVPLSADVTAVYSLRAGSNREKRFEAGINFSQSIHAAIVTILGTMHRLWSDAFHNLVGLGLEEWSLLRKVVGEEGVVEFFREIVNREGGSNAEEVIEKKQKKGWTH